jgi:hypothetical protein
VSVSDAAVAAPILRVIQVERCARGNRQAAEAADRASPIHDRSDSLPNRLMNRTEPAIRRFCLDPRHLAPRRESKACGGQFSVPLQKTALQEVRRARVAGATPFRLDGRRDWRSLRRPSILVNHRTPITWPK